MVFRIAGRTSHSSARGSGRELRRGEAKLGAAPWKAWGECGGDSGGEVSAGGDWPPSSSTPSVMSRSNGGQAQRINWPAEKRNGAMRERRERGMACAYRPPRL